MKYVLIRARKRSLSLQVSRDGQVVARAPLLMPKFMIDRFVEQKSSWIQKRLLELEKPASSRKCYFTIPGLKTYIAQQVEKYSALMGLYPTGLRFTQVNSYWGTCAPSGILSFNLALRYTPRGVVTYVVVHELSHLRWRGHGPRFWHLVETTYPKTQAMRSILRKIPRHLI